MLKSFLILVFGVPYTVLLLLVEISVCRGRDGESIASRIGRIWSRGLMRLCGLSVRVIGREHIRAREPYVFVANHESMLDIAVLLGFLPAQFRWMAKKELFSIPLFGTGLEMLGTIPVERGDARASLRSMRAAVKRIREGASVTIFPEGTRSRDGRMRPFRPGAFYLAVQSRRPAVPLAILGTYRALPPGSLRVVRGPIHLIITPPIPTDTSGVNKITLTNLAQERIERLQRAYAPGHETAA